jgi:hypothetical protein
MSKVPGILSAHRRFKQVCNKAVFKHKDWIFPLLYSTSSERLRSNFLELL